MNFVEEFLVKRFLASQLQKIAKGEYGKPAQTAYNFCLNHAATTGAALGVADAALYFAPPEWTWVPAAKSGLLYAAGTLSSLGLVAGFHAYTPEAHS